MSKATKDKTYYILIGNGASIQLVNDLNLGNVIDLINLFNCGDRVPWPDNDHESFLSNKHCPELWLMGARPTISKDTSAALINDVITSMNVYNSCPEDARRSATLRETHYYKAYCQLISFLLNEFIYYNNQVENYKLSEYASNKTLENIYNLIETKYNEGHKIRIISYNYDIFLERILKLKGISFKIAAFEDFEEDESVVIFKPHGSISFMTKTKRAASYQIEKDPFDSVNYSVKNMDINMEITDDKSIINPIIPPAGDANRTREGWVKSINENVVKSIASASESDRLIIYGLSYGHVDRMEIDKIITSLPYNIDVCYINPYPSQTFEIVLSSVFKNYSQYKYIYKELFL